MSADTIYHGGHSQYKKKKKHQDNHIWLAHEGVVVGELYHMGTKLTFRTSACDPPYSYEYNMDLADPDSDPEEIVKIIKGVMKYYG